MLVRPTLRPVLADIVGPGVALWGPFDAGDIASALSRRVLEHELRRRLPFVRITAFAPSAARAPAALDAGPPPEPLGDLSPERLDWLADQFDAVVMVPGEPPLDEFLLEGLGRERERRCPAVWLGPSVPRDVEPALSARLRASLDERAFVSVGDEPSRHALVACGLEREIRVVPHLAVLASRAYSPMLLDRRLRYIRHMGWYPPEGAGAVLAIGERADVAALRGHFDHPVVQLPAEATVEDHVAAVAAASTVVVSGATPRLRSLASLATGFGVPVGVYRGGIEMPDARAGGRPAALASGVARVSDPAGEREPPERRLSSVDAVGALDAVGAVDAALDAIAGVAQSSASRRLLERGAGGATVHRTMAELCDRLDLLAEAHGAVKDQLLTERIDHALLRRELSAKNAELREASASLAQTEAQLAETQAELERVVSTRTWRYLLPLRRVYAALRRR